MAPGRARGSLAVSVPAAIAAIALVATFLLASARQAGVALAIVPSTFAAFAVVLAALPRARALHAGAAAGVALGLAPGIGIAATMWVDRPLIAAAGQVAVPLGATLGLALAGILIVIGAAHAGEVAPEARTARGVIPIALGLALGAAVVARIAGAALAPTVEERVASLRPSHTISALLDEDAQSVELDAGVTLTRRCEAIGCVLEVSQHEGARRTTVFLGRGTDRAPIGIARLGGTIVVAPVHESGALDVDHAIAFDRVTTARTGLRASALGTGIGVPLPWRVQAWVGLGLAAMAMVLALHARRRRGAIERGLEVDVDRDGTMRTAAGAIARAHGGDAPPPGPAIVLDLTTSAPSYRGDAAARAQRILSGTRASHLAPASARIVTLELAALGALAVTHAPLVAAWLAGWSAG